MRDRAADLGSAWGMYVPEYVIELLRRHPDESLSVAPSPPRP